MTMFLTLLITMFLTSAALADTVSFTQSNEYFFNTNGANNTFSRCVATGDINGDGIPDVAVSDRFSDEILLLVNCGQGSLSTPMVIRSSGEHHNRIIEFEDLNNDGFIDLASASGFGATVFLNLGTSQDGEWLGYSESVTYTAGSEPHWIHTVDLNADGYKDLLVANYGEIGFETGWHVFFNEGDGTFGTGIEFNLGLNARCISIVGVNLDQDDDPDIAVVSQLGYLHIYENLGLSEKGEWAGVQMRASIGIDSSACSVRALDLELDGDFDLSLANRNRPQFSLIRNLGEWNFVHELVDSPYQSELVEPSDINGDGYTDLTVIDKGLGSFHVYVNDGTGQFTLDYNSELNTVAEPKFISFADLDQDNDLDSIVVNSYPTMDWGSIIVSMNDMVPLRDSKWNGDCQTIWSVDDDGLADFVSIQEAIDAASDGDEIVVMPGVYTSSNDVLVNLNGKAIWLHSIIGSEATYIDGLNQPCRGIVCENNEANTTIIEGFTITNCSTLEGGSGILCSNSSPIIKDCQIINNSSSIGTGGGVLIDTGSPEFYQCLIAYNTAIQGGGIGFVNNGNPILVGCQTKDNVATIGGGLYTESGSITIVESLFCQNSPDQIFGNYVDGGGNSIGMVCYGGDNNCPDLNADTTIDVNDLLLLIGAWGNTEGIEDINLDGIVDVTDFMLLIANWGPCK